MIFVWLDTASTRQVAIQQLIRPEEQSRIIVPLATLEVELRRFLSTLIRSMKPVTIAGIQSGNERRQSAPIRR